MAAAMVLYEMLLDLDRQLYPESQVRHTKDWLQWLLEQAIKVKLHEQPGLRQLRLMRNLLLRKTNIRYAKKVCGDDFTLTQTFLHRQSSCLGLSALYMSISDALDLRFGVMLYDGHISPCYMPDNDNVWHIDPITMVRPCEAWLAAVYNGPIQNDGGKALDRTQFLGVYLCNLVVCTPGDDAFCEATLQGLQLASELFPEYPTPWINRAIVLHRIGRDGQAQAAARRALELNAGLRARRHLAQIFGEPAYSPVPKPGGHEHN